jgi:hypothetical protein
VVLVQLDTAEMALLVLISMNATENLALQTLHVPIMLVRSLVSVMLDSQELEKYALTSMSVQQHQNHVVSPH